MVIERKNVKKILFITLSNLGDIILTTPVFDEILKEFPGATVDVITGMPGKDIFSLHPSVVNITYHGKHKTLAQRISQAYDLRKIKYDLVIDLKNSLLPYILGARYKTSSFQPLKGKYFKKNCLNPHKVNEHLYKLVKLGLNPFKGCTFFMPFASGDEDKAGEFFGLKNSGRRKIIINPGAKSHLKRWPVEKFAELSDMLVKDNNCAVFVTGNADDAGIIEAFVAKVKEPVVNLCTKTSLGVLAVMMQKSDLVITNDSAPLHVASAVNAPTVAIFGPTDEIKYGPLAGKRRVLKSDKNCRPCENALCSTGPDEGCIVNITVDEVYQAARELLI